MPIGSGLSAQLGIGEESTWGTRVAPTRFLDFNSEGLGLSFDYISSAGLRAGSRLAFASRQIRTTKNITGDFALDVPSKGAGLLFKHGLGTIATFTPTGGTTARVHRAQLGALDGKSLTIQVGKPSSNGTVNPFDYLGGKIASWTMSNDVNGMLVFSATIDGTDELTNQTLATPTYATAAETLNYVGGLVTLGGTPSIPGALPVTSTGGTATNVVTSVSMTCDNALKTDRYFIRQNANKLEQLQAGLGGFTGSFDMEFASMTEYNRFTAGTNITALLKWEGSTIEGAFKYAVYVLLPSIRLEGATPGVGGPDVLSFTQNWTAFDDGTNPPVTIDYVTTDTAP